jgi:hypothetical protein
MIMDHPLWHSESSFILAAATCREGLRTPATDIVLAMMLVLLGVTGLAFAFTELFHG